MRSRIFWRVGVPLSSVRRPGEPPAGNRGGFVCVGATVGRVPPSEGGFMVRSTGTGYVRPTPTAVRIPRDLLAWLAARRSQTGTPINRIIVGALVEYRNRQEAIDKRKARNDANRR